jgi:hypothetical protein
MSHIHFFNSDDTLLLLLVNRSCRPAAAFRSFDEAISPGRERQFGNVRSFEEFCEKASADKEKISIFDVVGISAAFGIIYQFYSGYE